MARPLRIERVGAWYHITGRGNERRSIFRDDRDRQHFCDLLAEVVERFNLWLHAYVLMDNHYHLILELNELNLSRAGQWLNGSYVSWFNRRHSRCGHLFQGRFKAIIVSPQEWGLELSRYVHLNPVRLAALGLGKTDRQRMAVGVTSKPSASVVTERIGRLRDYRWSSYRFYIGLARKPDWLTCQSVLDLGGGRKEQQRRRYREYVESAVREGVARTPWEDLKEQVALGSQRFVESLRRSVMGNIREQRGAVRLRVARPALKEVIARVEELRGERWAQFRDRYGDRGRELVLYLGQRVCGLKLSEVGQAAGMDNYKAVAAAIRRYEERLKTDKAEQKWVRQACQL
jgi:REP element-mobilizing transposase RayT